MQDAPAAVRGFKLAHWAACLCVRPSVCHGRCVFIAEVALSRGFVYPRALLAIPDRRLDAPDLMSGTHITGHDAKLPVISDPDDLCAFLAVPNRDNVSSN